MLSSKLSFMMLAVMVINQASVLCAPSEKQDVTFEELRGKFTDLKRIKELDKTINGGKVKGPNHPDYSSSNHSKIYFALGANYDDWQGCDTEKGKETQLRRE